MVRAYMPRKKENFAKRALSKKGRGNALSKQEEEKGSLSEVRWTERAGLSFFAGCILDWPSKQPGPMEARPQNDSQSERARDD